MKQNRVCFIRTQTSDDKAKHDFIPLFLKKQLSYYMETHVPVSMIVGHVLIFTEAAASLERRILMRC